MHRMVVYLQLENRELEPLKDNVHLQRGSVERGTEQSSRMLTSSTFKFPAVVYTHFHFHFTDTLKQWKTWIMCHASMFFAWESNPGSAQHSGAPRTVHFAIEGPIWPSPSKPPTTSVQRFLLYSLPFLSSRTSPLLFCSPFSISPRIPVAYALFIADGPPVFSRGQCVGGAIGVTHAIHNGYELGPIHDISLLTYYLTVPSPSQTLPIFTSTEYVKLVAYNGNPPHQVQIRSPNSRKMCRALPKHIQLVPQPYCVWSLGRCKQFPLHAWRFAWR